MRQEGLLSVGAIINISWSSERAVCVGGSPQRGRESLAFLNNLSTCGAIKHNTIFVQFKGNIENSNKKQGQNKKKKIFVCFAQFFFLPGK